MGRHADRVVEGPVGRGPVRPLYARALRLKHINPGDIACFVLLECSFGLAMVCTLAGIASWWSVAVLPVAVAVMVKLNDVVAGLVDSVSRGGRASSARRSNPAARRPAARRTGNTAVPRVAAAPAMGAAAAPPVAGTAAAHGGTYPPAVARAKSPSAEHRGSHPPAAATATGASAAARANPGCSTRGGSSPRQNGARPRTAHRHGRGGASAGAASAPKHRAGPARAEPELPTDPTGEELIAFFREFGGDNVRRLDDRRSRRGLRGDTPS